MNSIPTSEILCVDAP